jgi:transcriptional regulator with XRE-family HTH domain
VPDPPTPTVSRRWLASELRRLRENASRTLEEVAGELECSRAKVSRIELAQVGVHPRDVAAMLTFYGVDPEIRAELLHLAREARQKGWWWHDFRDLDEDSGLKQVAFVDNETAATSIRTYQAQVVFGLFQREAYARAVLKAIRLDLPDDEIDRHVNLRMKRQDLLDQGPPELSVVLDEAVLRRHIGGRDTMHKQLKHLMEVADHPKVKLQVLPDTAGAHAGLDGSFMILGFSELGPIGATDKDMVSLEHTLSDQYLREPSAVDRYVTLFEAICQRAYGTKQSQDVIAKATKEFSRQ